jgi:carboxypeptidase T
LTAIRVFLLVASLACALLMLPSPGAVPLNGLGDFNLAVDSAVGEAGPPPDYAYRNFSVVLEILEETEADHSDIVKVYDIGDSWEKTEGIADRDILAVKISDNVESDEDEPEVLIMALHHAREWPTTEIALQLIENLTNLYGFDSRISWLVDNRETWIVPVVNPDGLEYAMMYDDMWRKNRRDNGDLTFGVDLNRNYDGSANGDPLGEWGGAGTSDDPSSDVYCGEYAFSEPETQAIRDLAQSRSFTVAIDFHTYSNLVMWPWGYTTDLPEDNDDLVRIGTDLAALNDYEADQSVGLYPTTGDSLDWLYGSEDVFTFLFEVGEGMDFNPDGEDTVLEQIAENIPPALHLIEVAGDRQERQFDIDHTPLSDTLYSGAGFVVSADVTAARGVDTSLLSVAYSVDGGSWAEVEMSKVSGNDTYSGVIPAQAGGSVISYYLVAYDESGVRLTSPVYAPYDVHTFTVIQDTGSPVADAGPNQTVTVGATTVLLDASDSSDPDGVIENYTWVFTFDGVVRELFGEIVSFEFDIVGTYTVTLTVTDDDGATDTDTMTVTVQDVVPTNEPPVADAGGDQTVTVGAEVTLDGTDSSDLDGTIENYTWAFTYDGEPEEAYDETATFTFEIVGNYTVTLTVTDDDGATDTDIMTVTVQAAVPTNEPPVASAGTDQVKTVGDEVTFDGSGSSDSDGTVANYTWTFTYDGKTVKLYTASPKFTFEVAGTYTVTLTVTDDDGATDTDTVSVVVEAEEVPDDDKKSFLESYGLPLGIVIALIVAALVAFFVMKGRKGDQTPWTLTPEARS